MKIQVVTALPHLAEALSDVLSEAGHQVESVLAATHQCRLRYSEGTALETLSGLMEALRPFMPQVEAVAGGLPGELDAEVHLGDSRELGSWDLKIHTDSPALAARLQEHFLPLGFTNDGVEHSAQEEDKLYYGGATTFARQVVRWVLAREGIRVREKKEWGDGDNDVWLYLRDPAFDGRDLRELFTLAVECDDYVELAATVEAVQEAGFARVEARPVDLDERGRFELRLGPFHRDGRVRDQLQELLDGLLEAKGIDPDAYPLVVEDDSSSVCGTLRLPLGAYGRDALRPYAGASPARWDVVVHTDDPEAVAPLVEALEGAGYTGVRVVALPASVLGFRLAWGAAAGEPETAAFLSGAAEQLLEQLGVLDERELTVATLSDDNPTVELDLPLRAWREGTLDDRVRTACGEWELSLKTPDHDLYEGLAEELKSYSWKSCSTDTEEVSTPAIKYGGAPPALVQWVAELVERHTGIRCSSTKEWGNDDDDIWVYLPRGEELVDTADEVEVDLSAWFDALGDLEAIPLVEVGAEQVRVGHVTLRRRRGRHALAPRPSSFAHYCLDGATAETLVHVAESAALREPCLLEGETSVSKTSIVLYLASLLDQPVVRINLNGQTDTGELVGRFMPESGVGTLPVDPSELVEAIDLLEDESQRILLQAEREGRQLTRVEVQQIVANERMSLHPWRWQDGLVVSAMRSGWWVVLDELNLAEPQILERLNPVLEREPGLVLTEFDNSVIGGGGEPVHPDFRVFATMNPAEYAGRSALSPAYRDRWRATRHVPRPGEAEYREMLFFLVYGQQPDVRVLGRPYSGATKPAPLAALADLPDIDGFLLALSRFHTALEAAVGQSGGRSARLGARRRERYVFTRRGLLSVMDYLASAVALEHGDPVRSMRSALLRYYLGRVSAAADRAVVVQLLDAAGIGPTTWMPGGESEE